MASRMLALLISTLLVVSATAATVSWSVPRYGSTLPAQTVAVGEAVDFSGGSSSHDLWLVTGTACSTVGGTELQAATTNLAYVWTPNATGTFYFMCSVGTHCSSGQKVTITVGAAAVSPSPTSGGSAAWPAQVLAFLPLVAVLFHGLLR